MHPSTRSTSIARVLAAAAALLACADASAGGITLSPATVELEGGPRELVVRNSGETATLRVVALAWRQGAGGEMVLTPTRDLAVFPPRFTVAKGGARLVRIGSVLPAGPVERAYRLLVEELGADGASARARVAVPVFQAPAVVVRSLEVSVAWTEGRRAGIEVRNTGTVRLRPATSLWSDPARGPGRPLWRDAAPWYVLAGGTRVHEVDLAAIGTGAEPLVVLATDGELRGAAMLRHRTE